MGLHFGSVYDTRIVFHLGAATLWTLPWPLFAFSMMCQWADVPEERTGEIEAAIEASFPYFEAMMKVDAEFEKIMKESEQRIQSGESVADVQHEIERRMGLPLLPEVSEEMLQRKADELRATPKEDMMECECGCGEQTNGTFKPGHDQKLRARLERRIGTGGLLALRDFVVLMERHKSGELSDSQLVDRMRALEAR